MFELKKLLRNRLLETITGGIYIAYHGSESKIEKFLDDFVGGKKLMFLVQVYTSQI